MPLLVRHGLLRFPSADVMRYLGRKVKHSETLPTPFGGKLERNRKRRQEGERINYRMNGNPVKFCDRAYSESGSVLRSGNHPQHRPGFSRIPAEGKRPEDDLTMAARAQGHRASRQSRLLSSSVVVRRTMSYS